MKSIEYIKDRFVKYRAMSGRKFPFNTGLKYFFIMLEKKYPNEEYFTQEMLDEWFTRRETETALSYQTRFYHVMELIRFAKERKYISLQEPMRPKPAKQTYVPHFMTDEEIKRFFIECDRLAETPFHKKSKKMQVRQPLVAIEVPVFYRLMYSTGMRPPEVRGLRRSDLNFSTGEMRIHNTKGYNEHIIVLHDTMLKLMQQYDKEMQRMMPNRKFMFPNENDEQHNSAWQWRMFQTVWKKANDTKCVAYCFRHNYAITNINRILHRGVEGDEDLIALSRSMGHASLKATLHYYNITPQFGKILEETGENHFNDILPNIDNYED